MAGKEYSLKAILSATDRISPVLKKVDSNIGKVGRSFSSFAKASVSLASKLALPLTALGGVGGFSLRPRSINSRLWATLSIKPAKERVSVWSPCRGCVTQQASEGCLLTKWIRP